MIDYHQFHKRLDYFSLFYTLVVPRCVTVSVCDLFSNFKENHSYWYILKRPIWTEFHQLHEYLHNNNTCNYGHYSVVKNYFTVSYYLTDKKCILSIIIWFWRQLIRVYQKTVKPHFSKSTVTFRDQKLILCRGLQSYSCTPILFNKVQVPWNDLN